MEYTYDDLLDITAEYFDQIDFTGYFASEGETDVDKLREKLVEDYDKGLHPRLPGALEGDMFKAFDTWDLTVYLRNRYNMFSRIETYYHYYLQDITDK